MEDLLAFSGIFERLTEPLVLLPERDPDEVYGLVSGVFEIAFGDVDVAVETREFAEGDDLVLPLLVWVLNGSQVLRLDLVVDGFLRDAE